MSGTSIVSKWHLVSFRIPVVTLFYHILHLPSTMTGTTNQAGFMKHMDDSQALWKSAEDVCLWVASLDGSKLDGSRWLDGSNSDG